MGKEASDHKSYKGPVSKDPRTDVRIWGEACKKEQGYFFSNKTPTDFAAARTGNEMKQNQLLRTHVERMNGDYLWVVEPNPAAAAAAASPLSRAKAKKAAETSAMAHLAMGVPDAETAFLRKLPSDVPPRVAHAALLPTVMPWQIQGDPCFINNDALAAWAKNYPVQELPPVPKIPARQPAVIVGPHAASVGAWQRGEVALSQWEHSDRANTLMEANKLAQKLAHERAQHGLARLLVVTEKASRGRRPRWFQN